MKRQRLGIGVALACVLTAGPAAARGQDTPESADAMWTKAMKANDLDAVVACYAPDAVMWFPDEPEARGTEAIRAVYARYFGEYTVSDAALLNTSYQTAGDYSSSWGNYAFTLKPRKGGDPVVLRGRYVVAEKRIGGKWLLMADHASATPAPVK